MSSPWTDLLFLHGHITDWRLAQQLSHAPTPKKPAPAVLRASDQRSIPARRSTLMLRLCLGIGSGELHRQ
jgi:hypothetical protein